jgi:hypothetical protein
MSKITYGHKEERMRTVKRRGKRGRVIIVEEGDTWEKFEEAMYAEGNAFPIRGEGEVVSFRFPCHSSQPRNHLRRTVDEDWFNYYMQKKPAPNTAA